MAQHVCDVKVVKKFLKRIYPTHSSFYFLYRIDPKQAKGVAAFVTDDLDKAVSWIQKQNRVNNIYFAWNTPHIDCTSKPHKTDIDLISGYHVDVDLPHPFTGDREEFFDKVYDSLCDLVPDTTPHIVNTGNGLQAFWPFANPIKATRKSIKAAEEINMRLANYFGGDSCHNIDRILRVPGTVNWPTSKKIKDYGYVPVDAFIEHITEDCFVKRDFKALPEVTHRQKEVLGRVDYSVLDYSDGYKPFTYNDVIKMVPTIETFELTGDKSKDAFQYVCRIYRAAVMVTELPARELTDDHVINIAKIVRGSEEEFLEHYDLNGWGKLGFDISRARDWANNNISYAGKLKKSAEDRKLQETPNEDLKPSQLLDKLYAGMRHNFDKDALVNIQYDTKGNPQRVQPTTLGNVTRVLEQIGATISWDDMRDIVLLEFENPDEQNLLNTLYGERLEKHKSWAHVGFVKGFMQEVGLTSTQDIERYLTELAVENRYHPWVRYVKSVPWDGVERIKDVAKCIETDNHLIEVYVRKMLYSMAATVKSHELFTQTENGLQISGSLVLVGPQGMGKSTFFETLVPGMFKSHGSSLRLGSAKETDAIKSCLKGVLCVLNELGQTLRKSEDDDLKDFLSRTSDEYRVAYARHEVTKPRMTVFVGTANKLNFKDDTGSRRFWPVNVTHIDIPRLEAMDLQQIHAEAYHMVVNENQQWWLTQEEDAARAMYNNQFESENESITRLRTYLYKAFKQDPEVWEWMTLTQLFDKLGIPYAAWYKTQVESFLRMLEVRQKEDFGDYDGKEVPNMVDGFRIKQTLWYIPLTPDIVLNSRR